MKNPIDHAAWIRAAMAAIADGGVGAVRVEVIAQHLGVTKGGFYRRFKDRSALIDATLGAWADGRIAAIEEQTRLDGISPAERLRSLIRLYADRVNAEGMAVELSVRQWARTSVEAAAVVARVDAARLRNVEKLYAELGTAPKAAKARAFLFYSFVFGQSLLFLDVDERRKNSLIAAATDALTVVPA
ncbi:MAG: TetR/AcrR family transcriptional regulator [Xanthobacteraceae bacterium]